MKPPPPYTLSEIESQMVYNSNNRSHYNYPLTQGTHTIKYTLKDPTTICENMFANVSCETFKIPNNVTVIDNRAFLDAYITNLIIGDGVTSIGSQVFWNGHFTNITLGSGIDKIERDMFSEAEVSSINISDYVSVIEDYAFCDVYNLDDTTRNAISNINSTALECEEEGV